MAFVPPNMTANSFTSSNHSDEDMLRPLEYFINRATDPFIDASVREEHINKLCERVNNEIDGATVAINVLGHKIVSPDQNEVYYSLQCIEELVRQCGDKVHNRVGKYRFLNQIVKIISPKYLGSQTSNAVKEYAIRLLFNWQLSFRHIPKIKEVYDSLKENGLIAKDPEIPEQEIAVIAGSSRCASFEDEEKSKLLKSLLSSGNKEDLQAANRLIKSLVKCEDKKTERAIKRQCDLSAARKISDTIIDYIINDNLTENGLTSSKLPEYHHERLKAAVEEGYRLRPLLFQYASEAAEAGDPVLEEILKINDRLNKALQVRLADESASKTRRFSDITTRYRDEEAADLLSLDYLVETVENKRNDDEIAKKPQRIETVDIDSLTLIDTSNQANNRHTNLIDDTSDVPFIGYNKEMTPVLPRRRQMQSFPVNKATTSVSETLLELATPVNENPSPSESAADLMASPIASLPEFVTLDPITITLADREPQKCFNSHGVEIMLYHVASHPYPSARSYVIVISNYNVHALESIELALKCEDPVRS
ncbi:hypothetical protein WR25_01488 [Diploscapter pachys]|uniref:VHS domain-containing protein n=1 Tax=Diploscapter pachys TaxID=2018661 RepID=A0A2A2JRA5_9BILA|nr:hypothetical protein WR25_01488 [Diploscapter pachys]